jgi:FKBP-type peptidyl-prolyl cis-trans isomerase
MTHGACHEINQKKMEAHMKIMVNSLIMVCVLMLFIPVAFSNDTIIESKHGLSFITLEQGSGRTAVTGDIVTIHFTGWLDKNAEKGLKFFNSREHEQAVTYKLGTERVMQGWNIGVTGMKPGEKRRVMIPSSLGYGKSGIENIIPENANLIFEIELLRIEK